MRAYFYESSGPNSLRSRHANIFLICFLSIYIYSLRLFSLLSEILIIKELCKHKRRIRIYADRTFIFLGIYTANDSVTYRKTRLLQSLLPYDVLMSRTISSAKIEGPEDPSSFSMKKKFGFSSEPFRGKLRPLLRIHKVRGSPNISRDI